MKRQEAQNRLSMQALAAAIARSPIVVKSRVRYLPAGFDDVDVAVLEWIAAEACNLRHRLPLM